MHLQTGKKLRRWTLEDIGPERKMKQTLSSIDQVHRCGAKGKTVNEKWVTLYVFWLSLSIHFTKYTALV